MSGAMGGGAIAPEDQARANLYAYLAALLSDPPSGDLLRRSAAFSGDGETPLGKAVAQVASAAAGTDEEQTDREYTRLFIGLGRGELLPFASYYMSGNLHDKPLARLRRDMARLGISRSPQVKEPEDHIASLLEIMSGLISGRYGQPATVEDQRTVFVTHLEPWAARFFDDLQAADSSRFYRAVGALGGTFMMVETRAFDLVR